MYFQLIIFSLIFILQNLIYTNATSAKKNKQMQRSVQQ